MSPLPRKSSVPAPVPHRGAERVLRLLAASHPVPLWRERIADETGYTTPVVSAIVDELQAMKLLRLMRPFRNDEFGLTMAGDYACRVLGRGAEDGD